MRDLLDKLRRIDLAMMIEDGEQHLLTEEEREEVVKCSSHTMNLKW